MRYGKINEKILGVVFDQLPLTSLPSDSGVFIIDRSNPDAEYLLEYITTFPFVAHVSTKSDNEMKAAKAAAKAAKDAEAKIATTPVEDDDDGWDEDAPYTKERLLKELALSFRQMREGKLRPVEEVIRELKEMAANDRKRKHNVAV
jgi:hypothetical protein